jgi:serine/threonine-protein kinase
VRPYAQRALLDGIEIARGEQRVVFPLTPGLHRIQIEHACCEPFVREIDAADAAAAGELRVPLSPRPARLRVEGDPATRVFVAGRLLGTAGDSQRAPLPVEVPEGGANAYEGQAELRLELDGHVPYSTPVRIRAGGDVTIAAPRLADLP